MKIEEIRIHNFRCFGPEGETITLEKCMTAFVGGNGSGKTATLQALSRLFGVTATDRHIRKKDFHIPVGQRMLHSGATLSIDVIFSFPELEGVEEDKADNAIPEFFSQMVASAPGSPLKARMRLQATWTDDGTFEGNVDEDIRWIRTLDDEFKWDECKRVLAVERGSIQLIYVPAARDAETQVAALLKGRLWQAAKWSDKFREDSAANVQAIQQQFEHEKPAEFILKRLTSRWNQVHEADTDTRPVLRLVESRFEELVRKVEFTFFPDEAGQERALVDLSDGQRSLFHIALTATTLEAERDVFLEAGTQDVFDSEKLRQASLTILAIEEPENSLSPFFLSRIVGQAREIGSFTSAQVVLSSHSSAILSRIEPEEVRYFRLDRKQRCTSVCPISMPDNKDEASQYVRLAIRAYPELYFARFVILGEGDSERVLIPRIADAMDIQLDPSFVPIVPIGGRYVSHFWRLLNDLHIPHVTLLDLDLGRAHGGARLIADVVEKLKELGRDLSDNSLVKDGTVDFAKLDSLQDDDLLEKGGDHPWLKALQEEGVFFSFPLDIDFAMLHAFPKAYQHANPGGRGPRGDAKAILEKKATTLKTGGNPALYHDKYDDEFKWYPYLFLNRSKPETHIAALARIVSVEDAENAQIDSAKLGENAPAEIKALIQHVKEVLTI